MNEIRDKLAYLFNHLQHQDDDEGSEMVEEILLLLGVVGRSEQLVCVCGKQKDEHSITTLLCPDRMGHFEAN